MSLPGMPHPDGENRIPLAALPGDEGYHVARDPRVRAVRWRDLVAVSPWEVASEATLSLPWLAAALGFFWYAQHTGNPGWILAALVSGRAANEPADRAGIDPTGGRTGRAEIGVVGVSGDDHESGGPPVVGRGSDRVLGHRPLRTPRAWGATRPCSRSTLLAAQLACAYALRPRLRSSPPTSEASCMSG